MFLSACALKVQPYRPSSRVRRVSGPDPSSPGLPGALRSSAELRGALRSSPIQEHAKWLQAFED
eukprot:5442165-Alexandrium_andersonii.AAC.1